MYYTDKIPVALKIFFAISIVIIPLTSLFYAAVGYFIALILIMNFLVAVLMSYVVFLFFPFSVHDEQYVADVKGGTVQTRQQRFDYAIKIVIILAPVLLFFYMQELVTASLILIYIMILSISPALSNPKVGLSMVVANIIGGVTAILAYRLMMVVPDVVFMILLVVIAGLLFGMRVFKFNKMASIYKSAFSTFLLIFGMVLTSDSSAASEVWSRVIQIAAAVIYVVLAFRLVSYFSKNSEKS